MALSQRLFTTRGIPPLPRWMARNAHFVNVGRPEPPGGAAVLAAPLPPPLRGGATAERLTLKKTAKSSAKQATKVAGRLEKEAALE